MIKKEIKDFINNYAKTHHISKKTYSLFPLYLHLGDFSHSIGFTNHAPKKDTLTTNYNSVGYSAHTNDAWGYMNEHQENIAKLILSHIGHEYYKHAPQEILF